MGTPLKSFGPTELFNLVRKSIPYVKGRHLEYIPVYASDGTTIDPTKSPIVSVLENNTNITLETQINIIDRLTTKSTPGQRIPKIRELFVESGTEASNQCKYVFDAMGKPIPTTCWLCGFRIMTTDSRLLPECEHIIPAAAALVFYGVLDNAEQLQPKGTKGSDKASMEDKGDLAFYELNYDIAHSECNSPKKGSLLFINLFDTHYNIVREPTINESVIDEFIDSLLLPIETTRRNSIVYDFLSQNPHLNVNDWKLERKAAIIDKLTPLLQNISRSVGFSVLHGADVMLRNINYIFAKYVVDGGIVFPKSVRDKDGNITWVQQSVKSKKDFNDFIEIAQAKLTRFGGKSKKTKRKHNGKSVRRSTAKGNGSASRTYRKVRASNRKRT